MAQILDLQIPPVSAAEDRRLDIWSEESEADEHPLVRSVRRFVESSVSSVQRVRISWALPRDLDEIIQSWDTANTVSEWADWTVCTTWGRLGESIYLLHVHRERLLFPDLMRTVRRLADRFDPSMVLIEDHASGTQLLQMLREQASAKAGRSSQSGTRRSG